MNKETEKIKRRKEYGLIAAGICGAIDELEISRTQAALKMGVSPSVLTRFLRANTRGTYKGDNRDLANKIKNYHRQLDKKSLADIKREYGTLRDVDVSDV